MRRELAWKEERSGLSVAYHFVRDSRKTARNLSSRFRSLSCSNHWRAASKTALGSILSRPFRCAVRARATSRGVFRRALAIVDRRSRIRSMDGSILPRRPGGREILWGVWLRRCFSKHLSAWAQLCWYSHCLRCRNDRRAASRGAPLRDKWRDCSFDSADFPYSRKWFQVPYELTIGRMFSQPVHNFRS